MEKLLASAVAVAVLLARPSISIAPRPSVTVSVNWASEAGIGTSRTITTLQVVNNPVLDRYFNVNGTTFPNPIHEQVWGSLRNLSVAGLQMARFVPWYPYPRKAVAELFAPQQGKPLSWNFTLLLGQLTDFFEATADVAGADTVINFSTEPCWMFNENGITRSNEIRKKHIKTLSNHESDGFVVFPVKNCVWRSLLQPMSPSRIEEG